MTHLRGFTLCLLLVSGIIQVQPSGAEEVVICSFSSQPVTMSCSGGAVIDFQTARRYKVPTLQNCSRSAIPEGNCYSDLHYFNCHGNKECTINSQNAKEHTKGCNGERGNIMYLEYSCYQINSPTRFYLPMTGMISGRFIDIVSPGFPEYALPQHIRCCMKPQSMVRWTIKQLLFKKSGRVCREKIKYTDESSNTIEHCSLNDKDNRQRLIPTFTSSGPVVYTNQENPGGKLWIHVEGMDDMTTTISVSCDFNPEDDECNFDSLTTQDTTTTTSAVTTQFTDDTSLTEQDGESKETDDDEGVPLLAVVGAVVGLIILTILAIIIVCFIKRRRQKPKQTEINGSGAELSGVDNSPPLEGTNNIYANDEDMVDGKIPNGTGTGRAESRDVYACVNESLKTKNKPLDKPSSEETIMCENEQLYESAQPVQRSGSDVIESSGGEVYAIVDKDSKKSKRTDTGDKGENKTNDNDTNNADNMNHQENCPIENEYANIPSHGKPPEGVPGHMSVIQYADNDLYVRSTDLNKDNDPDSDLDNDLGSSGHHDNEYDNPMPNDHDKDLHNDPPGGSGVKPDILRETPENIYQNTATPDTEMNDVTSPDPEISDATEPQTPNDAMNTPGTRQSYV